MKNLLRSAVPALPSVVVTAAINDSTGTSKPHSHSGQMPAGEPRFGDQKCLEGSLSFWQIDPNLLHRYQL